MARYILCGVLIIGGLAWFGGCAKSEEGSAKGAPDTQGRAQDAPETVPADTAESRAAAKEIRRQKVAALLADARKLYDTQQFHEARDLLRQATIIDPQDENAALFLRLVSTKIIDRDYARIMNRTGVEVMRLNSDFEHMIPYADLMVYPDNWPEITRKRGGGETTQDSAANRAARDRLEEPLKEIVADMQGLEKVLNYIRDNMGGNIFVNWPALQAAGIDRNTPVSVNLREVPFRKALTTVLAQVGGGKADLGYTIDEGIVTISTKEDLTSAKYQVIRVYDIRDMLVPANAGVKVPPINVNDIAEGRGGGFLNPDAQAGGQERQAVVNMLMDTIKATVAPESWLDAGGTIGSIRELNGQLIINQTVENQFAVYNLIQQMRETRSIQIGIESRMFLVPENFLAGLPADVRVRWDLKIATGEKATTQPTLGTAAGGVAGRAPRAVPPEDSAPGYQATIIDNWTLTMLVQASQADKQIETVTARRVTLRNGIGGSVGTEQQENIVTSFVGPTVRPAASPAPSASVAPSAMVVTDVTPTVSADRRYVVMSIDKITLSAASAATAAGSDAAASGSTIGNFPTAPAERKPGTFVSIPDGGTLLIHLGPIPGDAAKRVGLLFVRPSIIVHRQIENNLFGAGYDRAAVSPASSAFETDTAPATKPATAPATTAPAADAMINGR